MINNKVLKRLNLLFIGVHPIIMNIHDLREAQARFESQIRPLEKERKRLYQLRADFVRFFNNRRLEEMRIDEYVIGMGAAEEGYNFCYTLERQLEGLGRIIGATAIKFGIYYGRTKSDQSNEYRFSSKWGNTARGAYTGVRNSIIQLIDAGRNEDISAIVENQLSTMFKGKILATYFPDRYLNIFSDRHLNYFLIQLDLDTEALIYGDTVYKRETLLEFKKSDPVMKHWSIDMFQQFLYTEYPGRPPDEETVLHASELDDYRTPEFSDTPVPEFIELNILAPNEEVLGEQRQRSRAGKTDYEKEARKLKKLGDRGEKLVMDLEVLRLRKARRFDLAKKVERVSLESDTYGYDIASFETDGSPRHIEVKATTARVGAANFYFTENEYQAAREKSNYFIYMVYEVTTDRPKIWPIKNPFFPENNRIRMKPVNYQVTISAKKTD